MATEKGLLIAFDPKTADRVLKATRSVESMGLTPEGAQTRQTFSVVQVVVPRSAADGNGFYPGELYSYDPSDNTFTLVNDDILIKQLPASL